MDVGLTFQTLLITMAYTPYWVQEIIIKDYENLKTPKAEYGNEVYEAVTMALTEINCYNPSGRLLVTELWNFKEKRKATLKEGVSHLLEQLKVYKRKSNSR